MTVIIISDECVYVTDGDLFHRVILQSGSALNPWALVDKPELFLRRLLTESDALLNCTLSYHFQQQQQQHQQLTDCLRHVPVNQLISTDLPTASYRSLVGPVVSKDDRMMTDVRHPLKLQDSSAQWSQLSLLLGFVNNEGTFSNVNRNYLAKTAVVRGYGCIVWNAHNTVLGSNGSDINYKHVKYCGLV